jgi:hypothetical protein
MAIEYAARRNMHSDIAVLEQVSSIGIDVSVV